jgi:hypothetical protein
MSDPKKNRRLVSKVSSKPGAIKPGASKQVTYGEVADGEDTEDYSLANIMKDPDTFNSETREYSVELNFTFFTNINQGECVNLGTTNQKFGWLTQLEEDVIVGSKKHQINIGSHIEGLIEGNRENFMSLSYIYDDSTDTNLRSRIEIRIKNVYIVAIPDRSNQPFNPCVNFDHFFAKDIKNYEENTTLLNQYLPLSDYVFIITKNVDLELNRLKLERSKSESELHYNVTNFLLDTKPVLKITKDTQTDDLVQLNLVVDIEFYKDGKLYLPCSFSSSSGSSGSSGFCGISGGKNKKKKKITRKKKVLKKKKRKTKKYKK